MDLFFFANESIVDRHWLVKGEMALSSAKPRQLRDRRHSSCCRPRSRTCRFGKVCPAAAIAVDGGGCAVIFYQIRSLCLSDLVFSSDLVLAPYPHHRLSMTCCQPRALEQLARREIEKPSSSCFDSACFVSPGYEQPVPVSHSLQSPFVAFLSNAPTLGS